MILLNKIPVLDKGFVAKFDSSCDANKLKELAVEYFQVLDGKFLAPDTASLTLLVKCPLYVQLNFSNFGFRVIPLHNKEPLESYLPNVGEVGAKNHQTSIDIAEDMARTSAALPMNQKTYLLDGCDRFTAQILTPINTYTTVLVHGVYNDWCRFVSQKAPSCINAYVDAINQIIRAEWR